MVMTYSPGWLWLEEVGPVFWMLRLIADCTLVGKVAVLFVSSPSGIALFGSAIATFVSRTIAFGAVTLMRIVLWPGGSGGMAVPIPGIVAPKQSTIPSDSLHVNAPAPGAASNAETKVTPAGRMSRTETFNAALVP